MGSAVIRRGPHIYLFLFFPYDSPIVSVDPCMMVSEWLRLIYDLRTEENSSERYFNELYCLVHFFFNTIVCVCVLLYYYISHDKNCIIFLIN